MVKECVICGKEIVGHTSQLYCEDCKEYRKETQKLRKQQRDLVRKIEKSRAKARNENDAAIIAINCAARDEGITYGQYVAKHNIK